MRRIRFRVVAMVVVSACAALVPGLSLAAHPENVAGTWSSRADVSLECSSPILLCRKGVLKNTQGVQVATFYFTMESLLPNLDGTLHFTGFEVQTYADGVILAEDEGTLTPSALGPWDADVTITVLGGSGAYASASGVMSAVGSVDLLTDQASGTYSGVIHRPHA